MECFMWQFFCAVGIAAIVTGLVTLVFSFLYKRDKKKQKYNCKSKHRVVAPDITNMKDFTEGCSKNDRSGWTYYVIKTEGECSDCRAVVRDQIYIDGLVSVVVDEMMYKVYDLKQGTYGQLKKEKKKC